VLARELIWHGTAREYGLDLPTAVACQTAPAEVLGWTTTRIANGAVEGMNNKIKSISHRSFGFRSTENFIAAEIERHPLYGTLGSR